MLKYLLIVLKDFGENISGIFLSSGSTTILPPKIFASDFSRIPQSSSPKCFILTVYAHGISPNIYLHYFSLLIAVDKHPLYLAMKRDAVP